MRLFVITILVVDAIVTSVSAAPAYTNATSPHVDQSGRGLLLLSAWIPNRMELGIQPIIPYEPPNVDEDCNQVLKDNPLPCTWPAKKKMCCHLNKGNMFVYCPYAGGNLQVGYCPNICYSDVRRGWGTCVGVQNV